MAGERIKGTVLTFFSTASAVGKTLLSCNMAAEIARRGARTCVVDLDLQFGDVCNYLQISPTRTIADAQQALNVQGDSCRVQEFLLPFDYDEVIFYVMASPTKLEEAYNMSVESIKNILKKLQEIFDYVIVDTSSMFSELNLAVLDMSTIIFFMGIVDFIPTIKNMKIGSDTLKELNYDKDKIRYVLNRSDAVTRIPIEEVENHLLNTRFDFVVLNNFKVASRSIQTGVPLVFDDGATDIGMSIKDMVTLCTNRGKSEIAVQKQEKKSSGSLFSRLFGG